MARVCPECAKAMMPETVDGVTVDVCSECAGIWLDQGELGRLMHQHPGDIAVLEDRALPRVERRQEARSSGWCPSCAEPMTSFHYLFSSPILLDSCERCGGVWVEDGELRKIEQWVQSSRNLAADERVREEAALATAQLQIQHDDYMRRQQNLRSILRLCSIRHPYGRWLGW